MEKLLEYLKIMYLKHGNYADGYSTCVDDVENYILKNQVDGNSYGRCHQCDTIVNTTNLTSPIDLPNIKICDICIEQIMSGQLTLRDADSIL